jgi:hypothetical protein
VKQFTVIKVDNIILGETKFLVAYNEDMSTPHINYALSKLSDEELPQGLPEYPYAYEFSTMGSQFYLALMILAQNMDQ